MAADKCGGSKAQAWFCTTGLPSDVVIQAHDMSFHLHKFPLMSKSRKLHHLITEREEAGGGEEGEEIAAEDEHEEEAEEEIHHISLPGFPGGSDAFEAAAKFCYGVKIELTAWNVAPLRCAAEYLEMTEEYAEDNLISRTDRFLAQSVLRSLKESVQALKSCEDLMPLAEDLGIVNRCIDSIASRACSSDPGSLFGWPVNEPGGGTHASSVLWNRIDRGARSRRNGIRSSSSSAAVSGDSWFEDLAILSLPIYKRLISAIRATDLSAEILEGSLISYAKRAIPGLSRSSRKHASAPIASETEQREMLETVITNLPLEKCAGLATTKFLFGLLRTANILRASEASRSALERKIGSQLEQATVDDLLMPSYSYLVETLYDVDCAERILRRFLEDRRPAAEEEEEGAVGGGDGPHGANRLVLVGKLVDGYLAEIASDANLMAQRFFDLALVLPDHARVFHDGLYRAVDVYLKTHHGMTEEERERVCGVIDCQKLTLEACTHAAQNERLPLRIVVQVLFFEQLQLRRAIAGTLLTPEPEGASVEAERPSSVTAGATGQGETWRSALRTNQVLRLDMDSMRCRVQDLERECSSMRKKIERMDRGWAAPVVGGGGGGGGEAAGWSSFSSRLGCKFKTQVCDSHERTVVELTRRCPAEQNP